MQNNFIFKSVLNFRDIGGTRLHGEKQIRKGVIFRSATPDKISRSDLKKLISLNIRTIIDLRALSENNSKKIFPDTIDRISLPLDFEQETRKRLIPFLKKRGSFKEIDEVINSLYSDILDASVPVFRKLVELLLSPGSSPVLIHCRAGKDRTGILIALIQMALNAREESIVEDYMRSNQSLVPYYKRRLMLRQIITLGNFPAGNVLRAIEVKPKNIVAVMDRVRDHYGGIESYLNPPGCEKLDLKELREILISD